MELLPLGKAEEREERGQGDVEQTLRLPFVTAHLPPPGPRGLGAHPGECLVPLLGSRSLPRPGGLEETHGVRGGLPPLQE